MKTKRPSEVPRDRPPRPLPKRKRLDVERLHRGIVWVLRWMIFKRYRLTVAWVAREAGIGDQSLRDYLNYRHANGWHTESEVALVLGRMPERLEKLTRRWMRKYRRREAAKHAAEKGFRLL